MPERKTLLSYIEDLSKNKSRISYIYRTQYRRFVWRNSEIQDYATRTAAFLQKKGIKKGDRVILWGENSPEWVIAFLGCLLTGAIAVPVDDASPEEFARKIFHKTKARIAFVSEEKDLQTEGLSVIVLSRMRQSLSSTEAKEFLPAEPVTQPAWVHKMMKDYWE